MLKNPLRPVVLVFSIGLLATALAGAGTIEKKFPDGKIRLKYDINSEGDKEGPFEEFYPDGKPKLKATYKADQLDGPYKSYYENGKPHIIATYKAGELTGSYLEETPEGLKKLTATYKEGKLNGPLTQFEKGKPVRTVVYKDGAPSHSRSADDIKKKIAAILNAPSKGGDPDQEAALRRLQAYRYLAEVPYENMVIDAELNKGAQAAAAICEKIGRLDHNPKNPGLPEEEYKLAALGAKSCNLGAGLKRLDTGVDAYMFDSDDRNIAIGIGHRRWCLNPPMVKVGFGKSGIFIAQWIKDTSNKNVPDYDFTAFPPRGLMPVEFFGPNHAWNVTLNPKKYKQPTDAVQAKVYAVDGMFNKVGEPLKLNHFSIGNPGFAVSSCVIFRPEKLPLALGRRYWVEIEGLVRIDGKPAPLAYPVEFFSLK